MKILLIACLAVTIDACTLGGRGASDPVARSKRKKRSESQEEATSTQSEAATATATPSPSPSPPGCETISKSDFTAPYLVPAFPVFVTRLLKPCNDSYDKNTAWTAMGVPCTQGSGLVRWTDKYVNPKQVSFHMTITCPMIPGDWSKLSAEVNNLLGLGEGARLLSFVPLSIQFWELDGLPETGSGFELEMQTLQTIQQVWPKVREGTPMPVSVYGRESSWFQNGPVFVVKGDIIVYQRNNFRFEPKELKVLSQEEKQAMREKCDKVGRLKIDCAKIFD